MNSLSGIYTRKGKSTTHIDGYPEVEIVDREGNYIITVRDVDGSHHEWTIINEGNYLGSMSEIEIFNCLYEEFYIYKYKLPDSTSITNAIEVFSIIANNLDHNIEFLILMKLVSHDLRRLIIREYPFLKNACFVKPTSSILKADLEGFELCGIRKLDIFTPDSIDNISGDNVKVYKKDNTYLFYRDKASISKMKLCKYYKPFTSKLAINMRSADSELMYTGDNIVQHSLIRDIYLVVDSTRLNRVMHEHECDDTLLVKYIYNGSIFMYRMRGTLEDTIGCMLKYVCIINIYIIFENADDLVNALKRYNCDNIKGCSYMNDLDLAMVYRCYNSRDYDAIYRMSRNLYDSIIWCSSDSMIIAESMGIEDYRSVCGPDNKDN